MSPIDLPHYLHVLHTNHFNFNIRPWYLFDDILIQLNPSNALCLLHSLLVERVKTYYMILLVQIIFFSLYKIEKAKESFLLLYIFLVQNGKPKIFFFKIISFSCVKSKNRKKVSNCFSEVTINFTFIDLWKKNGWKCY